MWDWSVLALALANLGILRRTEKRVDCSSRKKDHRELRQT